MNRNEVLDALIEVCLADPFHRNPTNEEGDCLYRTETDADDNCIVGRLARLQGWELPECDSIMSAVTAAEQYGWPVDEFAACALLDAQARADDMVDGKTREWAELLPALQEMRDT